MDSGSTPSPSPSSSSTMASAVDRCYFPTNPDIIQDICDYLTVAYLNPEPSLSSFVPINDIPKSPTEILHATRQTLFSTALTCKRLLEPALDRLWRHLDSLFPLLKLLPAFRRSDSTWVLRGPIPESEWQRFDYYAFRVRAFTFTRDPDTLDIAMHVYFRLAQLRAAYIPTSMLESNSHRSLPLLPNLHHLHCPSTSQTDFLISGICLFLSPSLTSLKFEGISSVEDKLCGTMLYELVDADGESDMVAHRSKVEHITLRGRGLSHDTLRLVPRFSHLRVLTLEGMGDAITSSFLRSLGKLRNLSVLGLDLAGIDLDQVINLQLEKGRRRGASDSEEDDSEEDDEQTNTPFSSLGSLAVLAPFGVSLLVLKYISTNALHSLSMESPSITPQDLVQDRPLIAKVGKEEVISYIASRWAKPQGTLRRLEFVLRIISLDDGDDGPWGPPPPMLNPPPPPQMLNLQPPHIPPPMPMPPPPPPPPIAMPPPQPSTPYANPHLITLNTLSPLLAHHNLQHFRVEGYPVSFGDEDVAEIARSWRGLRSLEIGSSNSPFSFTDGVIGDGGIKKPTVKSLPVIAKLCAHLKMLKISLDLNDVTAVALPYFRARDRQKPRIASLHARRHPLSHISFTPPLMSSFLDVDGDPGPGLGAGPGFIPATLNVGGFGGIAGIAGGPVAPGGTGRRSNQFHLRDLLHLARHIDVCFPTVGYISLCMFNGGGGVHSPLGGGPPPIPMGGGGASMPMGGGKGGDGIFGNGSFWKEGVDGCLEEDEDGVGVELDWDSELDLGQDNQGEKEKSIELSDPLPRDVLPQAFPHTRYTSPTDFVSNLYSYHSSSWCVLPPRWDALADTVDVLQSVRRDCLG